MWSDLHAFRVSKIRPAGRARTGGRLPAYQTPGGATSPTLRREAKQTRWRPIEHGHHAVFTRKVAGADATDSRSRFRSPP